METLSKNDDTFPLHGLNLTSKEKPKWWECGGHVRGKKQSQSDTAGERGRADSTIKGDVQISPTQAAPQPPAHELNHIATPNPNPSSHSNPNPNPNPNPSSHSNPNPYHTRTRSTGHLYPLGGGGCGVEDAHPGQQLLAALTQLQRRA